MRVGWKYFVAPLVRGRNVHARESKEEGEEEGERFYRLCRHAKRKEGWRVVFLKRGSTYFFSHQPRFPFGAHKEKKLGFFSLPPPFSRTKERWKRGTVMAAEATMIHRSVLFLLSDRRGMGASAAKLSLLHFSPLCALRVDKNFPPSAGFLRAHSPLIQIPALHAYLCSPSPGAPRKRDTYVASSCMRGANEI